MSHVTYMRLLRVNRRGHWQFDNAFLFVCVRVCLHRAGLNSLRWKNRREVLTFLKRL